MPGKRVKIIVCGRCGCQYSFVPPGWLSLAACPDCGALAGRRWGIRRVIRGNSLTESVQFVVTCFACGARHSLDMRFKGQRIKCKACGEMFETDRREIEAHKPLGDA